MSNFVLLVLADFSPRLRKRGLIFLLSITRSYVVSVRRGFLFLLVLRICELPVASI